MTRQYKWQFEKVTENARTPERAHVGDLGYDLFANENVEIRPNSVAAVRTGIKIRFDEGWGGIISNRSSMSLKHNLLVGGGIIDNGYRGEICVILHNLSDRPFYIDKGDKIAQLIPKRTINITFEQVDSVDEVTSRGENGFGSSGTT